MAREKTERLLNLLIALSASSRPVTREELRQWLLEQYGADQSPEAFEKMFERDKDELRSMGIPIETVMNAHNEVTGYRVEANKLKLTQLRFSAGEIAVLNTAAALWSSASAASPTRSAIIKLEAASGVVLNDSPVLAAIDTAFPEGQIGLVLQAIQEGLLIRFVYQRPQGQPAPRHIAPWMVFSREGHWYVVGFDIDRDDQRVFRLSRIQGAITTAGPSSITKPEHIDIDRLLGTGEPSSHVVVRAKPGRALALRRRAHVDADVETFSLAFDAVPLLLRELAAHVPYVEVLEPEDVRDQFIKHVQGIAQVRS